MENFSGLDPLELSAGSEALAELYAAAQAAQESHDSKHDPEPDEHELDPAAK